MRFGPFTACTSRNECSTGDSSSNSPATHRYGHLTLSAWPSQVMPWRILSNSASSVMPDMYMKRFLKVGDASWKIVWQPGSWQTEITAQADTRGSCAVSNVPNSVPKLVPEQTTLLMSISGRLASQSQTALPVSTQFCIEK